MRRTYRAAEAVPDLLPRLRVVEEHEVGGRGGGEDRHTQRFKGPVQVGVSGAIEDEDRTEAVPPVGGEVPGLVSDPPARREAPRQQALDGPPLEFASRPAPVEHSFREDHRGPREAVRVEPGQGLVLQRIVTGGEEDDVPAGLEELERRGSAVQRVVPQVEGVGPQPQGAPEAALHDRVVDVHDQDRPFRRAIQIRLEAVPALDVEPGHRAPRGDEERCQGGRSDRQLRPAGERNGDHGRASHGVIPPPASSNARR